METPLPLPGLGRLNYFYLAMACRWKGQRDEAVGWNEKAMQQMPADKASMNAHLLDLLSHVHRRASRRLGIKIEEEKR